MEDNFHQTPFCPTCGRQNPISHSPEWLLTRFSGIFANILALLLECRRERRAASKRELCFAAYPDTPGGPPITAPNVVQATVTRERAKLQKMGWDVVGPMVTGTGYQLVALEQPH
ncbi:hypothetical protein vBRpoSV10_18 [Ruegeria phage vB_RpoS-V10]|nr:hypothetical protein DSS3P8_019 [Roseobacter phage DSS3P8]AWY09140.1 hypothetical protein vBRpoSV10_18 [Ruegeria phage vB_RpoS-V10]